MKITQGSTTVCKANFGSSVADEIATSATATVLTLTLSATQASKEINVICMGYK
jgi:hypothetical protein